MCVRELSGGCIENCIEWLILPPASMLVNKTFNQLQISRWKLNEVSRFNPFIDSQIKSGTLTENQNSDNCWFIKVNSNQSEPNIFQFDFRSAWKGENFVSTHLLFWVIHRSNFTGLPNLQIGNKQYGIRHKTS